MLSPLMKLTHQWESEIDQIISKMNVKLLVMVIIAAPWRGESGCDTGACPPGGGFEGLAVLPLGSTV